MNWGGFAGGLSQGFQSGVRMSKTIQDIAKERGLQELREKGMAEAEAQRAAEVQGMVKEVGGTDTAPKSGPVDTATPKVEAAPAKTEAPEAAPAATGMNAPAVSAPNTPAAPTAPPGPKYDTEGEAEGRAYAAKQQQAAVVQAAPTQPTTPQQTAAAAGVTVKPSGKFSVNGQTFDTREQALAAAEKAAPSARDLFVKNTVPKIADMYLAYGDPEKAKAWTDYTEAHKGKRVIKDWAAAFTAPDLDTAVTRFGKYYTDHIDDGVDYRGHKIVTKDDGTQMAVVTLKDKATGKTQEMELTREKMLALGNANNPQKLFEQEVAKQAAAEKAKFDAGLKAQERREARRDALALEGYRQDRTDKREVLRGNIAVDKAVLDAELGEKYKKATSPAERAAIIQSDLTKNDSRFNRMSPEEQKQAISDRMKQLDDVASQYDKGGSGSKAGAKPTVADKPMTYSPDLPVKYRKSDNKPFHFVNGTYVPIEGQVPAAGAAPAAPAQPSPAQPAPPAAGGVPPRPAPQAAAQPPVPVQTLAPTQQPAQQPPAQAQKAQTLSQVLNPGGNPSLAKVLEPRVQQIAAANEQLQQLVQQTTKAAASGDQRAVTEAARAQQVAQNQLNALLSDMNPQMRQAALAALAQQ